MPWLWISGETHRAFILRMLYKVLYCNRCNRLINKNNFQIEDCNTHLCTETKRFSGWTPWLAANATLQSANSGYTEKRFRFTCRAQTDDPSSVRVQLAKEEERYCRNDGSCLRGSANNNMNSEVNLDGGWSEWSSWLPCNQACGGGSQHRVRIQITSRIN